MKEILKTLNDMSLINNSNCIELINQEKERTIIVGYCVSVVFIIKSKKPFTLMDVIISNDTYGSYYLIEKDKNGKIINFTQTFHDIIGNAFIIDKNTVIKKNTLKRFNKYYEITQMINFENGVLNIK